MSSEPKEGDTFLVGVIGDSDQRYYWADDPKGREGALKWMQGGNGFKRVFKVILGPVIELQVVPPIAARLLPKPKQETVN